MNNIDQKTLVDTAIEHNLPPGDYFSLWDDLASWQIETLIELGLLPHHRLLDVGCGAMRLGLSAIDYLSDGNYFGVDAFPPYIELAKKLALKQGVSKEYSLLCNSEFEFYKLGSKFHFINAQSVFTHLSLEDCNRCMDALAGVVEKNAVFLFTYTVGIPQTPGFLYAGIQPMQRTENRDSQFFENLGEHHGVQFVPLDVKHPTGQLVALYRYP